MTGFNLNLCIETMQQHLPQQPNEHILPCKMVLGSQSQQSSSVMAPACLVGDMAGYVIMRMLIPGLQISNQLCMHDIPT